MTQLISEKIGHQWLANFEQISQLRDYANDEPFMAQWHSIKQQNKAVLAKLVKQECGIDFNTDSLFDVQVKRIHEYKRQLLNVLHVIHLYNRIKRGDTENWCNRCVLIGGKAAPGYRIAKSIIKLINNVAEVIDNDEQVGDKLKLAFMPNYGVSKMEIICPGTDLSEQVSTAGKEASGTGNMKFMMNGAVTIGTYDGANIEILDAVGADNFYLFGMKANEVEARRRHYRPDVIVAKDEDLKQVMHLLQCGHFNSFEAGIFDEIIASLLNPHDPWLSLADFRSYVNAQEAVAQAYGDKSKWIKMSIANTASSGFFSTDRTMQEYNQDIWKLS